MKKLTLTDLRIITNNLSDFLEEMSVIKILNEYHLPDLKNESLLNLISFEYELEQLTKNYVLSADLSIATAITIEDLRAAIGIQKKLEKSGDFIV